MTREIYASDARAEAQKNLDKIADQFIERIWEAIEAEIEAGGFFLTVYHNDELPLKVLPTFPDSPHPKIWYQILSAYFEEYDYTVRYENSMYQEYPRLVISWE